MAVVLQMTFSDFRMHFLNEKFCILIKISLKFVPKVPIDNTIPIDNANVELGLP